MGERFYRMRIVQAMLRKRREKRCSFILSKVNLKLGMSILDVGCGPNDRSLENYLPNDYRIVGIDLLDESEVSMSHPGFTYIQQDASDLSRFGEKEFDLAFSIGMMEHICNRQLLLSMARQIDRVSRQYVIVVPWKWAWIEPHFRFFFFQLLPSKLKVLLTRTFNLHNLGINMKDDPSYLQNHYQWLSSEKWKSIYPGSQVYVCPWLDTIAIVKRDNVID